MKKLITSESVTCGHPDKLCNQISDKILDEIINKDNNAQVAVETIATRGVIFLLKGGTISNHPNKNQY